jgi:catechol 2,3-dioxygenase-like lactoylglutathione lyase family enzyme
MSVPRADSIEPELGPAPLERFDHVSVPCRDLEEATSFYVDVLGGALCVDTPIFREVKIGGSRIGFGIRGTTFMQPNTEYPHIAFVVGPDAMAHAKAWLTQCEIPTTNYWTRSGEEALMFFRDPSGNLIELYCEKGFPGAADFPHGPAAGHGIAVDVDAIRYDTWRRPQIRGSREPVKNR